MMHSAKVFRPTAVALALSALSAHVAAQQATAAPAPAEAASAATKAEGHAQSEVQTVTVTATRRSERLQDVPLSVSAVSAEQLANAGVTNIQSIANAVSGVTFGASPADAGFRVRGVGTMGGFSSSSEQPVGLVIDGVVMGLEPVLESMVDVDHIEALKGPQGTQFGKNASSGVVSIITRAPRLGKFEGNVSASYGSLNERDLQAVVNVPLGESVALRVAAFDHAYDGYIDNTVRHEKWDSREAHGARVKLLFKPTSDLDVQLSADISKIHVLGPEQPWTVRVAPPALAAEFAAAGITPGNDNTTTVEDAASYSNTSAQGVAAEVNYHLADYTLTSVTSHRTRTFQTRYGLDLRDAPVFEGGGTRVYGQDTQEFRLTSPKGTLEYVTGVFWSRLKSDIAASGWLQPAEIGASVPAGVFVSVTNGTSEALTVSRSTAVFGDGKLHLGNSVSLLAGLRLTRDHVTASDIDYPDEIISELGQPPGFLVPSTGFATKSDHTSASKGSGRLGLEWQASKDAMLYGTVARGYLGPTVTYSASTATESNVKPQTVDDVTLGFKTQWLDRSVTLNASVFHDHYKQLQVGIFRSAAAEFVTENAGGLISKGFEVDASARLGGGFAGHASVTYADARFTDFLTQCPTTGDTSRCFTPDGATEPMFQARGYVLPGAPKVTTAAGIDYGTDFASGYMLDASLNVAYRSRTSYGVGETDYQQGGYQVWNAAIKLSPESERWSVGLYSRNLFDRHYQAAVVELPFSPPGGIVNWNTRDARRSVGVNVGYRF